LGYVVNDLVVYQAQVVNTGQTQPIAHVAIHLNNANLELEGPVQSTPPGAYAAGDGEIVWEGLLAPQATVQIQYTMKVARCGSETDNSCGGATSTASVAVAGVPQPWSAAHDLTITCARLKVKLAAPRHLNRQGSHTYVVDVSYANEALAHPVYGQISKATPAVLTLRGGGGTNLVFETAPEGCELSEENRLITCDLGVLEPGTQDQVSAGVLGSDVEINRLTAELWPADPAEAPNECDMSNNVATAEVYPMSVDFEVLVVSENFNWLPNGETEYEVKYRMRYRYETLNPNQPRITYLDIEDTWPEDLERADMFYWPAMQFSIDCQERLRWTMDPATIKMGDYGHVQLTGKARNPQANAEIRNEAAVYFKIAGDPEVHHAEALSIVYTPLVAPHFTDPTPEYKGILTYGRANVCPGLQYLEGLAQPNVTVRYEIYKDDVMVTSGDVTSRDNGLFLIAQNLLQHGPYWVQAKAIAGDLESEYASMRLFVDTTIGWDPTWSNWHGTLQGGPLAGQYVTYRFRNWKGDYTTQDWEIPGAYGFWNSTLGLYTCRCPDPANHTRAVSITADSNTYFKTTSGGRNLLVFSIGTAHGGIDISTACFAVGSSEPVSGTVITTTGKVLIDPDGYVFDIDHGGDYSGIGGMFNPVQAISGVTVTAYVSAPEQGGWMLWPAHVYSQTNPQVTDATYSDGVTTTGYFAFFTPPGLYYLKVEAIPGYQEWRSPVVTVTNQVVHVNVPYTPWPEDAPYTVVAMPEGLSPAVITIPVGSAVEWRSALAASASLTELAQTINHPPVHIQSELSPLAGTRAFDAGRLEPGRVYRRQFQASGVYSYTDASGHAGQVVVQNAVSAERAISGPGLYTFEPTCVQLHFEPGMTGTLSHVSATMALTYPTAHRNGLPRRYDIAGNVGSDFTATLSVCYSHADLTRAGIALADEPRLALYRYDAGERRWVAYPSWVVTETNVITTTTGDLSVWTIGLPEKDEPTVVQDLTGFRNLSGPSALPGLGVAALAGGLGLLVGAAVVRARRRRRR
jgi:hypothetical protein